MKLEKQMLPNTGHGDLLTLKKDEGPKALFVRHAKPYGDGTVRLRLHRSPEEFRAVAEDGFLPWIIQFTHISSRLTPAASRL